MTQTVISQWFLVIFSIDFRIVFDFCSSPQHYRWAKVRGCVMFPSLTRETTMSLHLNLCYDVCMSIHSSVYLNKYSQAQGPWGIKNDIKLFNNTYFIIVYYYLGPRTRVWPTRPLQLGERPYSGMGTRVIILTWLSQQVSRPLGPNRYIRDPHDSLHILDITFTREPLCSRVLQLVLCHYTVITIYGYDIVCFDVHL